MNKIKICHVIGNFVNGGVEAVIYNYFSHIDMEKYEVHIIGHGIRVQECADRFVSLGFKIHNITPKSVSFIRSCIEMEAIFKNEQFDIFDYSLLCSNLYLMVTPLTKQNGISDIEDLFEKEILDIELDGKKFCKADKYDIHKFYGKDRFSKYIVNNYKDTLTVKVVVSKIFIFCSCRSSDIVLYLT